MTRSTHRTRTRFKGTVYRAHNPQWAWTPLSGEGARRHGGRFNRQGRPALYCSQSIVTAIKEAQPIGRPLQPLVLCSYEVDATPVFDATDRTAMSELGADLSDLECTTWAADMLAGRIPASQAFAERLIAADYVGMRVRSFAVGADEADVNLVMWQWGDEYPTRVTLIDDESRLRRP